MATEKRLIGCGKGFKHGHFYKPWYRTYKSMMERCHLPTNGDYNRYGGKGVTVCEEWHDINKFAEWVEAADMFPVLPLTALIQARDIRQTTADGQRRNSNPTTERTRFSIHTRVKLKHLRIGQGFTA